MRCPESGIWGIYLDGEPLSTSRERLEDHLLTCTACQQVVLQIRREGDLIAASLAAEPAPADLMAVINRRLNQRDSADGSWIKIILPVLMLISTLLALGIGWLPRLEQLRETLGQHQGFLVDCVLLVVRAVKHLADAALAGEPLLPTTALLLACTIWLSISIRKGGYARG